MLPNLPPVNSKYIAGLKVVQFADLIDAKISALSTRGFARDLVDLYTAHKQKRLNWRSLLIRASENQLTGDTGELRLRGGSTAFLPLPGHI